MLELVIFDMDGVLVDSEPAITQASIESLKETFGITPKHSDFKEFTGMGDDKFIQGVAEKYGKSYNENLKLRAYEIYTAKKNRVKVFSRAKKLIHNLYNINLKCAVASASDLVKVKVNIKKIKLGKSIKIITTENNIEQKVNRPLYIITGTDVKNKKPDPEIFLKAAETAGIFPENTIVIEDAISGVKAAKAAGMTCIAVTTSFNKKVLFEAGADYVVNKLYDAFDIVRNIKNT
ncbi:MAG: HAD family phosphatase [Oscillospiraceae bacterium]|nr:HAD family phosphatase [Oscillospiraceae bacterium]